MIIISTQVNRVLNKHRRGLIAIPEDDLQVLHEAQQTFALVGRTISDQQRDVCLKWINHDSKELT